MQRTAVNGLFSPSPVTDAPIRLAGTVVLLTSVEPGNFGSFIYRDFGKLVSLAEIPESWRFPSAK